MTGLPVQRTADGRIPLEQIGGKGFAPDDAAAWDGMRFSPRRPSGAALFPAALTVNPSYTLKLPLDELDEWDGGTVPAWITQDTGTDIVHITKVGVYVHNLELAVNNTTDARAVILFRCYTTNGSGRAYAYVPAGESRTVTFDRTHPYFGDELGGDQLLYVEVSAGGSSGTVVVSGSGNTMWSICKIA